MARPLPRRRPLFAGGRRARRVKHQMLPVGLPARLGSAASQVDGSKLRVLGSGDLAFQRILERVRNAERTVEIR
ncbi:MAG: hypothetical protein H0T42_24345, partial [Deltaproteobacteria bacterium]|nr:hypothetical protein [Deltaproteobacteria bacterium]